MKIFLDQTKEIGKDYIEDIFSSYDIVSMDAETFKKVIKKYENKDNEIYSCYCEFVNHVARFRRDLGENWLGEEIEIFAKQVHEKEYTRFYFNEDGRIQRWPIGFFG